MHLLGPLLSVVFQLSSSLQEEVAKEFGIPVQFQRFWLWAKRQNHTYRPNRPLTPLEEAQSVSTYLLSFHCGILCGFKYYCSCTMLVGLLYRHPVRVNMLGLPIFQIRVRFFPTNFKCASVLPMLWYIIKQGYFIVK